MVEPSTSCFDCGVAYASREWIEALVPLAYWLVISPTGDEGGLLCFLCMEKRFWVRGFGTELDHPPAPCRMYYPGGGMISELYPIFDEALENQTDWFYQPIKKWVVDKKGEGGDDA